MVAMNGISLVARESDLLSRSLIFSLHQPETTQIRTEIDLEKSFYCDLADILGAIFHILSKVMGDTKPIEVAEHTRLASAFEAYIRIGRVLGLEDKRTAGMLLRKTRTASNHALADHVVGQCIIKLMDERIEYRGSVSDLLGDIVTIAKQLNIHSSLLPKQPNFLSRRLGEVKSNLEAYGIFYKIKNIGPYREITIRNEVLGQ